jgi:hypothetical protein
MVYHTPRQAQLCETLADVEFASAVVARANDPGSPRMRLLERTLTAIADSPAAAAALAARLPRPPPQLPTTAPRDTLMDR